MDTLINWLEYRNYEHNRLESPHIDPIRWREMFANAETYEAVFKHNMKRIQKEGAWS